VVHSETVFVQFRHGDAHPTHVPLIKNNPVGHDARHCWLKRIAFGGHDEQNVAFPEHVKQLGSQKMHWPDTLY
jgi:hypothetical protein